MTPDVFQFPDKARDVSLWVPVLGMVILFLGMNMRVEFHIQRRDKEEQ